MFGSDSNTGISFTPREVGEHKVAVKKMGKHIHNSPFTIHVGELQVGDAKKVTVKGQALKEGKTHKENEFTIDTRHAGPYHFTLSLPPSNYSMEVASFLSGFSPNLGYGGLSLSIEGPSKAEIKCKEKEDGTLGVSYQPTEPGYYILNLKFADHHVEGSPFTVKVCLEKIILMWLYLISIYYCNY